MGGQRPRHSRGRSWFAGRGPADRRARFAARRGVVFQAADPAPEPASSLSDELFAVMDAVTDERGRAHA